MPSLPKTRRAFSLTELIATLSAIALLLCCTLALAPRQQQEAQRVRSMANLKLISTAAMTYAAEYNDRQMTLVNDNLSAYGQRDANDDQRSALTRCIEGFAAKIGSPHPGILLGFTKNSQGQSEMASLKMDDPANHWALMPISFDAQPRGWFRLVNAKPIAMYMNGRFFDPVYYAPDDEVAMTAVGEMFNDPDEFRWGGKNRIYWSSYSFSPAALWNPAVLARPRPDGTGGFTDPFSIPHSFKCPSISQASYANLKTHVMEHHWLHNRPADAKRCNDKRTDGTYRGCEPHYFNHAIQSEPIAVFFDGHVAKLPVIDAIDGDAQVKQQTQSTMGLWHAKPGGASDGYYESEAVDDTRTSFHIYTVDGIKGRDVTMK